MLIDVLANLFWLLFVLSAAAIVIDATMPWGGDR
jgi:hypothetical protein